MSSAFQGPNNLLDVNSNESSNNQDEMFLKVFGRSETEVVLDEKFFKVFGGSSTVLILEEKFVNVFGRCDAAASGPGKLEERVGYEVFV